MQLSPNRTNASRYITPEGRTHLSEELSYLWKVKRPQVKGDEVVVIRPNGTDAFVVTSVGYEV
jgi:transcription elongation GreA/GreB family factor